MRAGSPEFQAWVEYFRDEIPEMKNRHLAFQPEFQALWRGKDERTIGRVLKCHLLIEFYLTKYIQAANPALGDLNKSRITFSQKLALAKSHVTLIRLLLDGIEEINKIRNKIAHKLDTTLVVGDIKSIQQLINALEEFEQKNKRPIEFIEEFTQIACMICAEFTLAIQEHAPKTGAVGYLEWQKAELQRLLQGRA